MQLDLSLNLENKDLIIRILFVSIIIAYSYNNFFKKYVWYLIYKLNFHLIKSKIASALSKEDVKEYDRLLIKNSLLKVASQDRNKAKIGLAELYVHSKYSDITEINAIYNSLKKISKTQASDVIEEELFEAICYFKKILIKGKVD